VTYRGFHNHEKLNLLALLLWDNARDWFDTLPEARRVAWNNEKAAFKERFQESDLLCWKKQPISANRVQNSTEMVDSYVTAMW